MRMETQKNWTDAFHRYSQDVMERIRRGKTEESIPTGGSSFTKTEWERALKQIDKDIDQIKEEQKERAKKQARQQEAQAIYQAAVAGKENPVEHLREVSSKVPYSYLAKDGIIEYNGVVFVCDERTSSICLGDMNDKKNVLNIPLSAGGCLKVNRDNLGELSKAIGMFSPEDINRIMRAIAQDNKAREKLLEAEDMKNGVGRNEDSTKTA